MADETEQQPEKKKRTRGEPKKLSEIAIMGRIEKLLTGLTDAEKRRVAFVFAEQVGLKYAVPTNGETH